MFTLPDDDAVKVSTGSADLQILFALCLVPYHGDMSAPLIVFADTAVPVHLDLKLYRQVSDSLIAAHECGSALAHALPPCNARTH